MKELRRHREEISASNNRFDWSDIFYVLLVSAVFILLVVIPIKDVPFYYFIVPLFFIWIYLRSIKILVLNENKLVIKYKYRRVLFTKDIQFSYDLIDRIIFRFKGGIGSDRVMQVYFKNTKYTKIRYTAFEGLYMEEFVKFMSEKGIKVRVDE